MLVLFGMALYFAPVCAATPFGFSSAGTLATARQNHTATLLPNGKILVAGGSDNNNNVFNSAELYDPATGTWTKTGGMVSARANHTATLLPNGQVLVAGGYNGTAVVQTAELYNPVTGTWTLTAGSMVAARGCHTATLLSNGQVLVTGGSNAGPLYAAEVYNPATGQWTRTGYLNNARYCQTATLLSSGAVLVAGGFNGVYAPAPAELYNPSDGQWAVTGTLVNARTGHTATLLPNGDVLVAGGQDGYGNLLSSSEVFSPANGTWSATGTLNAARQNHSATLMPDGQVLVAGGTANGNVLASAELYNPNATTPGWTLITSGSLAIARAGHTATLLSNGEVLFSGGINGGGSDIALTELCDPASGSWASTGTLSAVRSTQTATLLLTGKVLVAGGVDIFGNSLASSEVYSSGSGWSVTSGSLTNARQRHTATLLPSGQVLVAGGNNFGSLASAELFDAATGMWTLTGSLVTSRWAHTATLLSNGKVLVAGGSCENGVLSSAELYDPGTGVWTPTGNLTTARSGHTATLLPNGQVLVAGGTSNGILLATSELYNPTTGKWAATGAMKIAIEGHTATLLPNGQVLVAGGMGSSGGILANAQVYNPATAKWTNITSLSAARAGHTATLLPGGKVLVAGGSNNTVTPDLTSAELYDPVSQVWRPTGSLVTGRQNHTATLLPSGQTLVAGGICSGTAIKSAELYDAGLGFDSALQPKITKAPSLLASGSSLVLTGLAFTGTSGGSCGTTQDSSTNYPVVQLRAIDGAQVQYLLANATGGWSNTSFSSAAVAGFPCGPVMATVFVNGIPGVSSLLVAGSGPPLSLEYATSPAVFTVNKAATDRPSWSGGAPTAYSIAGALPSGLSMSASTGVITGTPKETSLATDYTVTASNVFGFVTAPLTITVQGAAPTVTTGKATGLTCLTGTLNGTVNPNGLNTTFYFEYGPTTAYESGTTGAQPADAGASPVACAATLEGLTGATTYHYKLIASNSSGISHGADRTFTTLNPPPPASGMATDITPNTATLSATVDGYGVSTAYIQWGPTAAYGKSVGMQTITGTGTQVISGTLTGLFPSTRYHFRVVEATGSRINHSPDAYFVTSPICSGTFVASHGDTPGELSNAKFVSFGAPAINQHEDVAFHAVISGTGIKPAEKSGIWLQTGSSSPVAVVRTGTAVSFQYGSTSQPGVFSELGDPVFNDNDEIAFLGTIKCGSGKSAVSYQGIWTAGTTGNLVQMAQIKGEVPDATGTAAIASFSQFVLTDQGNVAFLANLANGKGDTTKANDLGVWVVDQSGDLHFLARKGFPLVTATGNTPPVTALSIFATLPGVGGQTRSFNANGELMFAATFEDASQGIFTVAPAPDYTISAIWETPDFAPVTSGSLPFAAFESPIINDGGNAAFQAKIVDASMPAKDAYGLWAESGTERAFSMVARLGVPASYTGTSSLSGTGAFTELGNPVSNASDQVGFIGTMRSGSGKNASNREGVWMWSSGTTPNLFQVAQARSQAADCPEGANYSSFAQVVLPNQAGVVFVANLATGAGGVTAATDQGIWAADASGNLNLVARKGDVFLTDSGNNEVPKVVASLSLFTGSTGTGGQTRSFAADDTQAYLVYKVTFTDGTESIYKVVLPP